LDKNSQGTVKSNLWKL